VPFFKHDYEALEREYISSKKSIRQLCREHGIAEHSPVARMARRQDWAGKRAAVVDKASLRVIDGIAAQESRRRLRGLELIDTAYDALHAALEHFLADLAATHFVRRLSADGTEHIVEEPVLRITPRDAAILIDRLMVLRGEPSTITESRSVGVEPDLRGLPAEMLRAIADEAGKRLGPRVVSPALPSIDLPRDD
jgi:hypothetical protein